MTLWTLHEQLRSLPRHERLFAASLEMGRKVFLAQKINGSMCNGTSGSVGWSANRIDYVDGWRAIAVILVVLGHLTQHKWIRLPFSGDRYAEIGVLIFFFISGYVVSRSALVELATRGRFSIVGFYTRRIFRIVPPLLFYLTAVLVLGFYNLVSFKWTEALYAGAYLCNINVFDCRWYVAHTWSLAFEEHFYLFFAVLFGVSQLKLPQRIASFAIIGGILLLPFWAPIQFVGRTGFVTIYALFLAGYLAARHEPRLLTFLSSIAGPLFALSLFLTVAIPLIPPDQSYQIGKFLKFVYIASIPSMILASGLSIDGLLGNPVLAFLGRASYSIYLWQQLVVGPSIEFLSPAGQMLLACILLGGCLILFVVIERRLIGVGRRLSGRLRT